MPQVTEEVRVALETERKFEFYFIGAIFTILAAVVHTAEVYARPVQNYLELAAFLFLIISFLCALFALSQLMARHWVIASIPGWAQAIQTLQSALAQGMTHANVAGQDQPQPIQGQIDRFQANKGQEEAKSVRLRWWIEHLRFVRMWTFLLGLILLLMTKLWPVLIHLVARAAQVCAT